MEQSVIFIKDIVKVFRDKYSLGVPCSKQLIHIFPLIERYENVKVKLIKKPFSSKGLFGFIGYKYKQFVIVINTNKSLGAQNFTLAHEIYHLLHQREEIKKNTFIDSENGKELLKEKLADLFAIELLMPEEEFKLSVSDILNKDANALINTDIIKLQNYYGVDYIAITKRLLELKMITEIKYTELNTIRDKGEALELLTKQLGLSVSLNNATNEYFLSDKVLEVIKSNYDTDKITYDDLVTIFYWLDQNPEQYGYVRYQNPDQDVKDFINDMFGED